MMPVGLESRQIVTVDSSFAQSGEKMVSIDISK